MAVQRRSADSLSRDRLSEKVDPTPGSKFDTCHSTNRLGYRIERSYFSRYRCFRARPTRFTFFTAAL